MKYNIVHNVVGDQQFNDELMLSVACRDPTSGLDQNDEVSCIFLGLMHISVVIYSHTFCGYIQPYM